jgi:hypothetical protein
VSWQVNSASAQQRISELPPEIVSEHPFLDLRQLQHGITTFYTGETSYEVYIDDLLGEQDADQRIDISITIW